MDLFNKLLLDKRVRSTQSKSIDFVTMAQIWNSEVIQSLQQEQQAGMQGVTLLPKTERQLRKFHHTVAQTICSRRGAAMAEALGNVASSSSPALAPSVQANLKVMQSLIATAPNRVAPSAPPQASIVPTRKIFSSVKKDNKMNRQGEGKKKCMCGWGAAADGTCPGLTHLPSLYCQAWKAEV